MIINKDNLWLLWPETLSEKLDKGNIGELYFGDKDFTIYLEISDVKCDNFMQNIIAILPHFIGIDFKMHNNITDNIFVHFTITTNKNVYYFENKITYSETYKIHYSYDKTQNKFICYFNDDLVLEYKLNEDEQLLKANNSHLLIGTTYFPQESREHINSEFNITKMLIAENLINRFDIDNIEIYKRSLDKNKIVCYFDFKEKTDYKIFDHTLNNNHLQIII
jgi:hypothetical protein